MHCEYANDHAPLAKEEMVLLGVIDRLNETGRYCGMEINVEKFKVMRISRQRDPIQIMIQQKQRKNVKYFSYLGSMITKDASKI